MYSLRTLILNRKRIDFYLFLGVFLFLPIAVNLFLIQHKESKRYLCGENNQLFGLVSEKKIEQKEMKIYIHLRPNEMNVNVYLKLNVLI
jgi:hypothetical protein